jgi:MYXO-CTERM domain-containing protein
MYGSRWANGRPVYREEDDTEGWVWLCVGVGVVAMRRRRRRKRKGLAMRW